LLAKQLRGKVLPNFDKILDLQENDFGASLGLVDDSDLFLWNVIIEGPLDTLYEVSDSLSLVTKNMFIKGGYFKTQLKFPRDYPNNPPEMRFISKMWHPNIYTDGKVCISILHPPGTDQFNQQETADVRWRPILGVDAILMSVMVMLQNPNIESPANIDASKEYRDEREKYNMKVR
jgi:ubiquitin-conjugating enzyme E2 G1